MCPFHGQVSFCVFIKNKPNKYGLKLYILSDAETEPKFRDNNNCHLAECITSLAKQFTEQGGMELQLSLIHI